MCKSQEAHCQKCGAVLSKDEVAVTKKLINRGTKIYFCVDCLAEGLEVRPEDIREKIRYFRKMGCTLFD